MRHGRHGRCQPGAHRRLPGQDHLEITSPSTKEGRDGNRAPFAILRDALATGLAEDCELWLTWEKVSHNRRQLTWSRSLRDWAGLHVERTDEEIAQQDMHGDDQLIIPAESLAGRACRAGRTAGHRGVGWRWQLPGDGWSLAGCTGLPSLRTYSASAVSAKRKCVGHLSRLWLR